MEIEFTHVCADTETTGLSHFRDEIIEITVTEFNMSGVIGETKSFLCWPKSGYIPKGASDVNGITIDMVRGKPNYLEGGVREKISDFLGQRILIGHNVEGFDIKFMKLKPRSMEDTLIMCRRRFPGKSNKLKTACMRLNIPWDNEKAHRAEYDVSQTIELYLRMKGFEQKQAERSAEAPIFAAQLADKVEEVTDASKAGVVPSEKDKKLIATQAYSYSRINLYKQCPLKWYMQYIKGVKQPDVNYLTAGSVVHKIAEKSGEWCFRELFANKFVVFAKKMKVPVHEEEILRVSSYYGIPKEKVTLHDLGRYIFEHPKIIEPKFNVKGLYRLIFIIEKEIEGASIEIPSMPSLQDYELIIQQAMNKQNVVEEDTKTEIRRLAERFYRNANFSLMPGNMVLTEKKIAFDKNWKVLNDFFADDAFFRAVIDVIYYFGKTILIRDYKTSRTMINEKDMPEDMQLIIYILMIYKFIPRDSYDKIIVEIDYIRFGETRTMEIDDVEHFVEKATKWIADAVQDIEAEMLKTDGSAFAPVRNEFCHTCHVAADGKCPLFDKRCINNIDDPFNFVVDSVDECVTAWKRIEANKAENSRLTSTCKAFVKKCESRIPIDETATLDFYTKRSVEYDPLKTVQLMLKKGVSINDILSWMSFPPSQVEKFIDYKELKLSDEERADITKETSKTEFKALTEKEQVKYINS